SSRWRFRIALSQFFKPEGRLFARYWPAGLIVAWLVPVASVLVATLPTGFSADHFSVIRTLVSRCRITELPVEDVERLAVCCRETPPPNARFVGPPGPKTFRLWSRRDLAFNRAASP